ncbi:MAG: adenosine kinase [Victivallaceae bacterium]|nr:adenosine kinase [Victivallaceae bacterium]
MNGGATRVLGVGSPVVDLLLKVSDDDLRRIGVVKGGRTPVTPERQDEILATLDGTPEMSPGGSVGNTLFTLARLGFAPAMCGMVGLDMYGQFYVQEFCKCGGALDRFDYTDRRPNARCLSLITPDAERTMLTSLAAAEQVPDKTGFDDYDWIMLEGYLFAGPDAERITDAVRSTKAKICLDLNDSRVVHEFHDRIAAILPHVDIVFANADEAAAFGGKLPPEQLAGKLGEFCPTAVVKLGADGCVIKSPDGKIEHFEAFKAEAVDTTGAGDLFSAGFMYGVFHGQPIARCAFFGATLGAEAVKVVGTTIPAGRWLSIYLKLKI